MGCLGVRKSMWLVGESGHQGRGKSDGRAFCACWGCYVQVLCDGGKTLVVIEYTDGFICFVRLSFPHTSGLCMARHGCGSVG
jgi:hypothetical protein